MSLPRDLFPRLVGVVWSAPSVYDRVDDCVLGVIGCGEAMLGGLGFLGGGMSDFCILLGSLCDAIPITWVL